MTDPTTHCPRCDIEYGKVPGILSEGYEFLRCNQCGFRHYNDIDTRCMYEFAIQDGAHMYRVLWFDTRDTDVGTGYASSEDMYDDNDVLTWQSFDHWLPLDITVETLKVWFTFS